MGGEGRTERETGIGAASSAEEPGHPVRAQQSRAAAPPHGGEPDEATRASGQDASWT